MSRADDIRRRSVGRLKITERLFDQFIHGTFGGCFETVDITASDIYLNNTLATLSHHELKEWVCVSEFS